MLRWFAVAGGIAERLPFLTRESIAFGWAVHAQQGEVRRVPGGTGGGLEGRVRQLPGMEAGEGMMVLRGEGEGRIGLAFRGQECQSDVIIRII